MTTQSSESLTQKKCKPCEGGVEACSIEFARDQITALNAWQLSDDGKLITRKITLKNFVGALALLNEVAEIAETEQHHPDLHLTGYRHLRIDLTTHAIDGLSENDFILAAKIDAIISNGAKA